MHQPLRYWPGPPPFAAYGNGWTGGGGSFSGGGASGSFGASSGLAPFNNEQVTTLATGLICIGSADGRLIPLVPMDGLSPASTGDASAFARGTVCILSNGKVVPASQPGQVGSFSSGQVAPSGGFCVIWSVDGKIIPMNLCGG